MARRKLESLTRRELYQLVWDAPATQLEEEFGFSDTHLSRYLALHNIPRPGRGYWRQLAVGKRPRRTPLPYPNDHMLVARTRKALMSGRVDTYQVVSAERGTYLDVRVTRGSLARALRFLNRLIEALEGRGYAVRLSNGIKFWTFIVGPDWQYPLSISERVVELDEIPRKLLLKHPAPEKNFPYKRWETKPTGELTLQSVEAWSDRPGRRLEARISEIVAAIDAAAARDGATRHQSEAAARAEKERDDLLRMKALHIRALVDTLAATAAPGMEDAALSSWLAWARAYAAKLDSGDPTAA